MEDTLLTSSDSAVLLSDFWYALLLFTIIILAGVLGGVASYFLSESEDKSPTRSIVIGVVAAFIVPVFLNMISSNLLVEAQQKIDKLFIFAGFCILAAVFSRNFLENVYSKVIQQVGSLERKVEDASTEPSVPDENASADVLSKSGLTEDQYKLLIALVNGKYTYRTLSGLKKDSGFDSQTFQNLLNELIAKKMIDAKPNKEDKLRYSISNLGRKTLGEIRITMGESG